MVVEAPPRNDVEGPAIAMVVTLVQGKHVHVRSPAAHPDSFLALVRRPDTPLRAPRALDLDRETSPGHIDAVGAALGLGGTGQRLSNDCFRIPTERHPTKGPKPTKANVDEAALDGGETPEAVLSTHGPAPSEDRKSTRLNSSH